MATFAFKAVDLAGVPTNGELDAGDKQAVAQHLRGRGLIVLDIEEQKPASAGDILARFKKVKARDLTVATRQFSSMVSSGMSLLRSLYVLEEQTESDQLKEALIVIRGDVEAGISLSDALRKHPKIFNELYTAMVDAGETGGILDDTLIRVADQLEKDDALRRQVRAAMLYPGFVGGFAFIVRRPPEIGPPRMRVLPPTTMGQRRTDMKRRRHTPEQIIRKLREAERMLAEGADVPEVAKVLEVSEQTFHRWRAQYGGMKAEDAKELRELRRENARLKRIVADKELEADALRELASGNF